MTAIDDVGLEYTSLAGTTIGATPVRRSADPPGRRRRSLSSGPVPRDADETNTYFHEDLAVLREIGYLAATVPEAFGGWGLDLATFAHLQRRSRR